MALHRLPTELLDTIAHHLPPRDLPALATTATPFLYIAQRFLYRHLCLSPHTRNLALIPLLARKPSLARHVRSFCLRTQSTAVFASFYRLLAIALRNMSQLTSLHLFVDPHASWVLASPQSHVYPRLVDFACSFTLDPHVSAFLAKSDALLEIEFDDPSPESDLPISLIPSSSIPRLHQFSGSSRLANIIVPGRPVHTINLPSGDIKEPDILNLAKSSVPITIFGATTSCSPALLLDVFAHYMPHLAYLRLMTIYNFGHPPDISLYDQISRALEALPDIRAFEFSGMRWPSSTKLPREETDVHSSSDIAREIEDSWLRDSTLDQDIFFVY